MAQRPSPSTGDRLVYAVGDVHGYAAVLSELLGHIREDAARTAPDRRPLLVFVGDYVDRGPDSRGVIDAVLALEAGGEFEVVALKGNHEEALERFVDEPAFAPAWIGSWGEQTLVSYGVAPPFANNVDACCATQAEFVRAFPETHRTFWPACR